MRMRRIAGVAAATAVTAAVLPAIVASPASAATVEITVDCTTGGAPVNDPLTLTQGDTLIVNGPACTSTLTSVTVQPYFSTYSSSASATFPATWVLKPDATVGTYGNAGSATMIGVNSVLGGQNFYLIITAAPSPAPSPSSTVDRTVWHLSVGRPSQAASCDPGYAPSWAQWPNKGTGGFVCNKDVYAFQPDVPVP